MVAAILFAVLLLLLHGDPICSSGRGYYIAKDKDEIQKTIESLQGRIAGMSNAVSGLQQYMEGAF